MCVSVRARVRVWVCAAYVCALSVTWARSRISLRGCARGESNVINHSNDRSVMHLSLLLFHFILLVGN